ncbi:MAG: transposase, partial [Calditrichaeota bacterium]|nr:transposase [Calditrichota bacterium]
MSRNYKYWNQEFPHFISFATVGWIDVFTRRDYFNVMVDCINHTIDEKGLIVYGWCIMTNHVHMIIGTKGIKQQDLVRDLKSFSAKRLLKTIQVNPQESRKQWLL